MQFQPIGIIHSPFTTLEKMPIQPNGIFATRAPTRPNPIGLSVIRLIRIEGTIIHLANADILDGTPLLDIKPYVPQFDQPNDVRTGWLATSKGDVKEKRADDRFM